jgi:TatD DNase family protein
VKDAPLFDSHCHLDFDAFDPDRDAVLERARDTGVVGMTVAGVHPRAWGAIGALATRHPDVHATVGVHPQALLALDDEGLERALASIAEGATEVGAVAIGETGFDGHVEAAGVSWDVQGRVVDAHRDVAEALELPVIFHILRAHGQALSRLEARGPLPHGGVVHSYSGSAELVDRYVALGLHVSFAGNVTRPNAKKPRLAAARVPPERLLVETDAPDQPLHDATSSRNEPAAVRRVVEAVAEARGQTMGDIARLTTDNARALYRLV